MKYENGKKFVRTGAGGKVSKINPYTNIEIP